MSRRDYASSYRVARSRALVPRGGQSFKQSRRNSTSRRVTRGVGRAVIPIDMVRSSGLSAAVRNAEFKFIDSAINRLNNIFIGQGEIRLVNGISVGSTATSRVGRQVQMKSFEARIQLVNASVGSLLAGAAFCWDLVLDRQANAQPAGITDIWDSDDPLSLRNISNKKRFKVLKTSGVLNWASSIAGAGGYGGDSAYHTFTIYHKINIPVQYNNGTAGTVGDITSNALYFVVRSNAPVVATAGGTCQAAMRVRYTDA